MNYKPYRDIYVSHPKSYPHNQSSYLHTTCSSLVLWCIEQSKLQYPSRKGPQLRFHPWWTCNPNKNRPVWSPKSSARDEMHTDSHAHCHCVSIQKWRQDARERDIPLSNTFGKMYWFICRNWFWICACYSECVHVRKSRQFGGNHQSGTGKGSL